MPTEKDYKTTGIDTSEVFELCLKMANRYSKYGEKEELLQESFLASLEYIDKTGDSNPINIYFVIKKSMYSAINLKRLPVSVPLNNNTLSISRGSSTETWDGLSDKTRESLVEAVSSKAVPLHHADIVPSEDYTQEELHQRASVRYLVASVINTLSPEEQEVVLLKFWEDMTLREIGTVLKVSPETVRKRLESATKKLHKSLKYFNDKDYL
jgi:RNA polymerase sigma factor (sigma-70 family)